MKKNNLTGILFSILVFVCFVRGGFAGNQLFYEDFNDTQSILNNAGVIIGSGTPKFEPGIKNNAVNLMGNLRVEYPLPSGWNAMQGTVEFWFRPKPAFATKSGGFFDIGILFGEHPSSMGVFWNPTQNRIIFEMRDERTVNTQSWANNTINPSDTSWHRVAIVWKTNTGTDDYMQVFVDGIPGTRENMTGKSFVPTSHELGKKMTAGYCGWYGYAPALMDEMIVSDHPKSEDELSEDNFSPVIESFFPNQRDFIKNPGATYNFSIGARSPRDAELTISWYLNDVFQATGDSFSFVTSSEKFEVVRAVVSDGIFSIYIDWGFLLRGNTGISVFHDSIYIDEGKFLVKGVDYTPWLLGIGPDPSRGHTPLPAEFDNVTSKVTRNGITYVPDYSKNGKVEMWEVIQYDMETIKNTGANTIRI